VMMFVTSYSTGKQAERQQPLAMVVGSRSVIGDFLANYRHDALKYAVVAKVSCDSAP
jgi:hypothetical protein